MKPIDSARMHRRNASRKPAREGSSTEIIYGRNPVLESLSSGSRTFFEVIVLSQHAEKLAQEAGDVPVRIALREELDKMTGSLNHQGIAARVSGYRYTSLNDMLDLSAVVLLDSVEDPQNLGSIVRTSYALSGAGVIIPEHRSASVTPAVVRASSGATEHIRISRVQNLREAAKELKKNGFWLVGLDASARDDISSMPKFEKVGLVMGGEDSGIRPVIEGELDMVSRIPMKGAFNSLNVAQACAIALYELTARK